MCNEYIDTSTPLLTRNAEMLTGVSIVKEKDEKENEELPGDLVVKESPEVRDIEEKSVCYCQTCDKAAAPSKLSSSNSTTAAGFSVNITLNMPK